MKTIFRMMAIAIAAVLFAACGSKSATPEGAAEAFLKDYQKGNYEAMVAQMHFTKEMSKEDKAQIVEFIKEKTAPEIEKRGGIQSFEVTEVVAAEDGHSAKVKYTLHFGDGSESKDDMKLVNVDGKWMLDGGK